MLVVPEPVCYRAPIAAARVINAYTLTLSSLLLVGGAAGDRFGRRRLFIVGISIFAAASFGAVFPLT
jgi:MFS family permease